MISSGVTTVLHLQSLACDNLGSFIQQETEIIQAYRVIGIRASYSFAPRDQNRMIYAYDEEFIELLPLELRLQTKNILINLAYP